MDRKINFFDSRKRDEYKKTLSKNKFDVLVIGGGITGAGICLDTTSRGLKTCLIDMNDFASGTSSKSTKLIHGGLRYLEQFKFKLVHETGSERAVLSKIAPHIVKPEKMLLPIKKEGKLNMFLTRIALVFYDYLANVKITDKNKILSRGDTFLKEPLLKKHNVLGGAYYSEYRTEDNRLTIEIIKKSYELGSSPINYMKAINFIYKDNKVIGVKCKDKIDGTILELYAQNIINASGSWTDEVLNDKEKKLVLSKGIHIVVSREKFNLSQSIYFDAIDGRMIFAIPREDKVYIGTTDTEFNKEKDKLIVLKKEVNYLLNSLNETFLVSLKLKHIESSWVGLRPLIKDGHKKVSEVSREDEVFISKEGIITIAGGKLTGYRKMAERVVDLIFRKNNMPKRRSLTKNLKLFGNKHDKLRSEIIELGFSQEQFNKYYNNYGDKCFEIFKTLKKKSKLDDVNLLISEYAYCLKKEMCHNLLDFFSQRNSMIYYNLDKVLSLIQENRKELTEVSGISEKKWNEQLIDLKKYIDQITTFN